MDAYGQAMPADIPTILATSGGIGYGRRTRFAFTALTNFAVELSGVTGRAPRLCVLATAMGDDKSVLHYLTEAQERGFAASHLSLFPTPNVDDITAHRLGQDVVRVFGGSVAGLLAMWRLHDVRHRPSRCLAGGGCPHRDLNRIDLLAHWRHNRLGRSSTPTCHRRPWLRALRQTAFTTTPKSYAGHCCTH